MAGWWLWVACMALLAGPAPLLAQMPPAAWGTISAAPPWFGYAHDHPTREAAEQAANAQCRRVARGAAAACAPRISFERGCGALALGNHGEWGAASAASADEAARSAEHQCNQHLPTEPCKAVVRVCSRG